eukprot:gene10944-biopygen4965
MTTAMATEIRGGVCSGGRGCSSGGNSVASRVRGSIYRNNTFGVPWCARRIMLIPTKAPAHPAEPHLARPPFPRGVLPRDASRKVVRGFSASEGSPYSILIL